MKNPNSLKGSGFFGIVAIFLSLLSAVFFLIAAAIFWFGFSVANVSPPEIQLRGRELEVTVASTNFISNYYQTHATLPSKAEYKTWAQASPHWSTIDGIGFNYIPFMNSKDKRYILEYWNGNAMVKMEIAGPESSYSSPKVDDKDYYLTGSKTGQMLFIFGSALFCVFLGAGCISPLFMMED